MNKLDSIKALKLLKDKYILTSSFDKEEYIFFENNGKIYVKTKKYSVSVSFSDFLDIYKPVFRKSHDKTLELPFR